MHRLTTFMAVAAALVLVPVATAAAQEREPPRQRAAERVPRGYEPPRGMCRLWIAGVPPNQQPAPTECATAIRRRPAGARVIFGDPVRGEGPERERPEQVEVKELRPRERPELPAREARPRPRARTAEPPGRQPPESADERYSREQWLDEALLATLYEQNPGQRADGRYEDGRATPRQRVGERGRDRLSADRPLEWAETAGGELLYASDVERHLLYGRQTVLGYGVGDLENDGLVPVRPGECYDRDFDGRCDDLSGGADGCFDSNRDGRCDDARWDAVGGRYGEYDRRGGQGGAAAPAGLCFDRDRDGRCDEPWSTDRRIPQTLPEMAAVTGLQRGIASYDIERWLRRSDLQARSRDRNQDGIPDRVVWLDGRGQVVQVWTDRDGDGIADRVEIFRDGLPVQVIER